MKCEAHSTQDSLIGFTERVLERVILLKMQVCLRAHGERQKLTIPIYPPNVTGRKYFPGIFLAAVMLLKSHCC